MTRPLAAIAASLVLLAGPAWAGQVTLTMADGRVTLVADNVTVRQILAEWSRVGQTKIVNGERVPGGSVTLTFEDMPERQVLDTLLRTASGYLAAPRAVPVSNASVYDRILILPSASAVPAAQPAGRSPAAAASFPGRRSMPSPAFVPDPDDSSGEDDEEEDDEESDDEEDGEEDAEASGNPPLPPGFTARPGQVDPQVFMPEEGGVQGSAPAFVPADRPGVMPIQPGSRMSPFQPIQTQRPGVFVPPVKPGQPQPFVPGLPVPGQPGQKPDEPPPL
jgi:hypothetical protein